MKPPVSPPSLSDRAPQRLLSPQRVQELLTTADPAYGRDFTAAEWSRIAERLSALARLVWRISGRRAMTKSPRGTAPERPETTRS